MTVTTRGPIAYRILFSNPSRGTVAEITPATGTFLSGRTLHDFNRRVAEAELRLVSIPSTVSFWDEVLVFAGASPATMALRFYGYLVPMGRELAPIAGNLQLRGRLIRAQRHRNRTEGGTDLSAGGAGQTEVQMLTTVLDACGLNRAPGYTLAGTGRTLGTVAQVDNALTDGEATPFAWAENEPGLAFVERLDEISVKQDSNGVWGAYRTYDMRSGFVGRIWLSAVPGATPALTFTEGVDIERGQWTGDPSDACTAVRVTGWDDGTGAGAESFTATQANPTSDPFNDYPPAEVSNPMIEFSATSEIVSSTGIAAEEVGRYLLAKKNVVPEVVQLTTPRDDVLDTAQTIAVQSSTRLGVSKNYFTGAVACLWDDQGWRMEITAVGGDGSSAPVNIPPQGGIALTVEEELIVSGGSEVTLYVVEAKAAALSGGAAITGYAWTASGGTPSSGSGSDTFVTSYTALSSQTISCVVTDSNSNTATLQATVPSAAQKQVVRRKLYVAGTVDIEADDADVNTWRTEADAGTVVANGPVWAAGDTVYRSTDELETAAGTSTPSSGTDVTALWMETDISATLVLAGLDDGSVYISRDAGATWVAAGTPEAATILKVVINRYNVEQWFALTAAGYYDTVDGGDTWSQLLDAGTNTFADVAHSFDRGFMVAGETAGGAAYAVDSGGNVQTWPGTNGPIVAIAPRIQGGYAAYDSSGRTYLEPNGDATFVAGTALPTGSGLVVQARGLWRDGAIQDLFYVAGGSGGAWKSIDGFGSSGGYFRIRQPSVGTAPAGLVVTQIGADGLLTTAKATAGSVVSSTSARALSLWNGSGNDAPPDADWFQPGYDTSSAPWAAAVIATGTAAKPTGTGRISQAATPAGDGEEVLLVQTFTPAAGRISAATLQFNDAVRLKGFWLNGVQVPGAVDTLAAISSAVTSVTVEPGLLRPGETNTLAVWLVAAGSGSSGSTSNSRSTSTFVVGGSGEYLLEDFTVPGSDPLTQFSATLTMVDYNGSLVWRMRVDLYDALGNLLSTNPSAIFGHNTQQSHTFTITDPLAVRGKFYVDDLLAGRTVDLYGTWTWTYGAGTAEGWAAYRLEWS